MTFYETITAAINDLLEHGFDKLERVETWMDRIRKAAVESMTPPHVMDQALRGALGNIYSQMVEKKGLLKFFPGVGIYTLDRVKPKLRAELDRRLMASAGLIKLNREKSIQQTLQRFAGWATSVPAGGSDAQSKSDVKDSVKKSLKQLPFEERRVIIDQGHKFTASLAQVVAVDAGAIAGIWHSNWRQKGYNYREDHKERDEQVYLIRGSWAHEKGLVKPGPAGYLDDITQPGEEVFCRCHMQYVTALRKLPETMLAAKGREELAAARAKILASL